MRSSVQDTPSASISLRRVVRLVGATALTLSAGLALAGAALLWFPYAVVIPGALAVPLVMFGFSRERVRAVLKATLGLAAALVLTYGAVTAHLRLTSVADLREWVSDSSHGIKTGGLSRIAIGVPRSMVNIGNDGLLFKRYLLADPLNRVSLGDLFRLSLWKVSAFYVCAGLVILFLMRSPKGRRAVALILLTGLPVAAFAMVFDGGAI